MNRVGRSFCLGAAIAFLPVTVQGRPAAAEPWSPPYCGEQPRISAVFDHDLPRYQDNGRLVLYSGADIAGCPDAGIPPLRPGYDGHSGWDFTRAGRAQGCGVGFRAGLRESLVYASADGRVHRSRWYHRDLHDRSDGPASAYGLHVELDHGEGLGSLYGHLAAVFVEEGQAVSRGQAIGSLGTTGNSSGPHLHWQAGKRGQVASPYFSFDPYGWDRRHGPGPPDPPPYEDPHHGPGWSERRLAPGAQGPPCPVACELQVVDDASPDVTFGCLAGGLGAGPGPGPGSGCAGWGWDARGFAGGHRYAHPRNGSATRFADYRCNRCGPGVYRVMAWVPFGRGIADTHVARYQVGPFVTVLDQHTEGGRWQNLGVFRFEATPRVRLTDRGDRYDYASPARHEIAADALMFQRLCSGIPPGIPSIPPEPAPEKGGRR